MSSITSIGFIAGSQISTSTAHGYISNNSLLWTTPTSKIGICLNLSRGNVVIHNLHKEFYKMCIYEDYYYVIFSKTDKPSITYSINYNAPSELQQAIISACIPYLDKIKNDRFYEKDQSQKIKYLTIDNEPFVKSGDKYVKYTDVIPIIFNWQTLVIKYI